jgi:hypothetical protein
LIQVIGLRKQQRRVKELDEKEHFMNDERKRGLDIKRLAKIYKKDEKLCPNLKGKINWDTKLVQKLLDIKPRNWEMQEVINYPPLYRWSIKRSDYQRGCIPDSEMSDCYVQREPRPVGLHNPNRPTEFEKLVIAEAYGRMELMRFTIRKYEESKIQIQVIENKDPPNTKVRLKTDL